MPPQDMFRGAYFGMCTDQFGVNWDAELRNPCRIEALVESAKS